MKTTKMLGWLVNGLRNAVSGGLKFAALFVGIATMLPMAAEAADAVWKGGATGDLNVGPWRNTADTADADITVDILNFPCDATVTQTVDTAVYNPFGSKGTQSAYKNRKIVFDMCGHTLWATRVYNGAHSIQGNQGTSFTFTNGTLRAAGKDDYSTTNVITTAGNTDSMSIVAVGSDTTLISSFCIGHKSRLRLLNGAKAYGTRFNFTAAGATNEVSNGAVLQFSTYFDVGTYTHAYNDYANAYNGAKVTIDNAVLTSADPASGGAISVNWGGKSYDNELIATNGATVAAKNIYVGSGNSKNTSSNGTFKVTGEGTGVTAAEALYCGHEVTSGNTFLLEDGAGLLVTNLYVGYASATNNTAIARGEETKISAKIISVGGTESSHHPYGNTFIFEDGVASASSKFLVNTVGASNMASIRSGATVTVTYDVVLGGARIQDRPADYVKYGAKGRIEVVGAGSTLSCGRDFPIRNSTGDSANAQELFVGDGATVTVGTSSDGLRLIGLGNRVVVSNGTLTVRALYPNGMTHSSVAYPATNSTFRIEGAVAKLSATYIRDLAEQKNLSGAPIFEFAIPEGGWTTAPVVIKEAFTISDDTRIRLDADALKAFLKAGGGTVPLIATDASSKLITANLDAISADLPEGCTLRNESGVISVVAKKPSGVIMIVW